MPQTPAKSRGTLLLAIDLGTSTTTAQIAVALDSFDKDGRVHRKQTGRISDMRAWPGGRKNDALGNTCLPTDLVYNRASGELLFWGFQAQQYLDEELPEPSRESVFVVEHPKLLLNDPDDEVVPTVASERYRTLRHKIIQTLGKDPYDVYEDMLNEVINHIIAEAKCIAGNLLEFFKLEVAVAFPSGWREYVHRRVAEICARAVRKALATNRLSTMVFGLQNVYTISETLCGIKEWLSSAIEKESISLDLGPQTSNLDQLQEGDLFLALDVGGGTGCITLLKLVRKHPLQVDQLDATKCLLPTTLETSLIQCNVYGLKVYVLMSCKALEVSGEAVDAEFERRLRLMISPNDYKGDFERLINQICRKFKEVKKDCGQPPRLGSSTWNVPTPGLRAVARKGIKKDCLKLNRKLLDESFDPVLDKLEVAILEELAKTPLIKAIVFLGQFGGSSDYLRNRMALSPISRSVTLYHSHYGKSDVVKGAMSERLSLQEKFVRKSETLRSYGTLITFPYYPGSTGHALFPHAMRDGAPKLERDGCYWLKVVEWAIPKATILEENMRDIGKDGRRHHTWPFNTKEIEFTDTIIVSDEVPPPPQLDGKSYTLWTVAHEQNRVFVNNEWLKVDQIQFYWNLEMSEKLDPDGNVIGGYEIDEIHHEMWPAKKIKHKRRSKQRILHYDLIWIITEMQVKTYVRAIFPNPLGPLTMQLAQERSLSSNEITAGESRSQALVRDIEISTTMSEESQLHRNASIAKEPVEMQQDLDNVFGALGTQLVDELSQEYQLQSEADVVLTIECAATGQPKAQISDLLQPLPRRQRQRKRVVEVTTSSTAAPQLATRGRDELVPIPIQSLPQVRQMSSDNNKLNSVRREGCYTCKVNKKRCDCTYTFNRATNSQSCNKCSRNGWVCQMNDPRWINHAAQDERKRLSELKRKSPADSNSSTRTKDGSTAARPEKISRNQPSLERLKSSISDLYD